MGIPYYFSYLIQNHKKIITKIENIKNINNLFIDSNSIIYDSLKFENFKNKTQFENYIIQNAIAFWNGTQQYVKNLIVLNDSIEESRISRIPQSNLKAITSESLSEEPWVGEPPAVDGQGSVEDQESD